MTEGASKGLPGADLDLMDTQRAIFESDLPTLDKMVLLGLLSFWSRESPLPFPPLPTLARRVSCTVRGAQKALGRLKEAGIIGVRYQKNEPNKYAVSRVYRECLKRPAPWLQYRKPPPDGDLGFIDGQHESAPVITGQPGLLTDADGKIDQVVNDVRVGGEPGSGDGEPGSGPEVNDVRPKKSTKKPNEESQGRNHNIPAPSGTGSGSSSPPPSEVRKKKQKETQHPRDTGTLELERCYADLFFAKKGVAWPGATTPDARARRAFKDLIGKVGSLEGAKHVLAVAWDRDWVAKNRCLPWEILGDCSKYVGEEAPTADELSFRVRAPTDEELAKQLSVTTKNRELIAHLRNNQLRHPDPDTEIRLDWLFEKGFHPENCAWVNASEWAQNGWAVWQAAHGNITPRFRMMASTSDRKAIAEMMFRLGFEPNRSPKNPVWCASRAALGEAQGWYEKFAETERAWRAKREKSA
jgi:hypothetical protein